MQNKSIYNLYQLWLYFVDKKYWDQIYYLYNNILEQDCEFYLEFKKFIDTNSKTDSYGNILNHDYLIKAMPTDKRRRLLDLFKSVAPNINKKHIICDTTKDILAS